jgi:TRAP-type C4-dicarboxylate transport system permease small subunit
VLVIVDLKASSLAAPKQEDENHSQANQLGNNLNWTRWIERISFGFAFAGGVMLMLLAGMTVVSVIGRAAFGQPVPGDIEITQYLIAVAISAFFPYCLFSGGNLIVDFFTAKASENTRRVLDVIGALTLAFAMGLFAWRTIVGTLAVKSAGESSMVIGMPLWWTYALMAPCFVLATLAAMALAAKILRGKTENVSADRVQP